jgi:hypothetical protein
MSSKSPRHSTAPDQITSLLAANVMFELLCVMAKRQN